MTPAELDHDSPTPAQAVAALRSAAGLPPDATCPLVLTGADPVLPSSFRLGTAALATIGGAAQAAAEIGVLRGGPAQSVAVDIAAAALECTGWHSVDGVVRDPWDPLSGLYACADGHVRIHANFAHHRDAALWLLGLPTGPRTLRSAVQAALQGWGSEAFEAAADSAGAVVAALRTAEAWARHPHAAAVAGLPLLRSRRTGDAPPRPWPAWRTGERPLHGLRVLETTRILAGPVAGRALAAWGADVLLVNAPHLPNIDALADTSRGKRSALLDLRDPSDRAAFDALLHGADVWLHGYRPGALAALGYAPDALAERHPGLVSVELSAWGGADCAGPWALRRGFDSIVQTATGFNAAEAAAAGQPAPRALPCQMIDFASGYLLALGTLAALQRQRREGGSLRVEVALAATGRWLWELGRVEGGFAAVPPSREPFVEACTSGWGVLAALRHPAVFDRTPAGFERPSVRPGHDAPRWSP